MNWMRKYWLCVLIALVVSSLVCFFVSSNVRLGGCFGTCCANGYNSIKPQIQNAVTAYIAEHDGELPPHQGTYNISTHYPKDNITCDVIDICALVNKSGDMLRVMPDGSYGERGESSTNFYSGECDNLGEAGEYVWLMDDIGNVYSTCIGDGCEANNEDGYQGTWPVKYESSANSDCDYVASIISDIASFVVPFSIIMLLCMRFKRRPQPPNEPADDL